MVADIKISCKNKLVLVLTALYRAATQVITNLSVLPGVRDKEVPKQYQKEIHILTAFVNFVDDIMSEFIEVLSRDQFLE